MLAKGEATKAPTAPNVCANFPLDAFDLILVKVILDSPLDSISINNNDAGFITARSTPNV